MRLHLPRRASRGSTSPSAIAHEVWRAGTCSLPLLHRGRLFGSLDQREQQVDDGAYTVHGAKTLVLGRSKFRFTVVGDTLTLEPVITAEQRKEALAKPGAFTDAHYMVAVAVPGTSRERVDCDRWC